MNVIGPMVQLQPEIMDNVNGDQALRYVSKAYGLPEQMLRPFDDVVQTRVERQEQQQQQQQMAEAQQAAEIANKAAPLMQQGA
jgi:LAS superfamily LD-carboxypeptidase LdcB